MNNATCPQPASRTLRTRLGLAGAVIAAASVGWLPAAALAQGTAKIGFVSTERIMKDANPAKAAQAKIEQDFARRDKELQDLSVASKFEADGAVTVEQGCGPGRDPGIAVVAV